MLCGDFLEDGMNGEQRVFGARKEKSGYPFYELLIAESFFSRNLLELLQHYIHRFCVGRGEYLHHLFLQG